MIEPDVLHHIRSVLETFKQPTILHMPYEADAVSTHSLKGCVPHGKVIAMQALTPQWQELLAMYETDPDVTIVNDCVHSASHPHQCGETGDSLISRVVAHVNAVVIEAESPVSREFAIDGCRRILKTARLLYATGNTRETLAQLKAIGAWIEYRRIVTDNSEACAFWNEEARTC